MRSFDTVKTAVFMLAACACITRATLAGSVLLIDHDPGITLYVDTGSGEAKLVGNPGAVMSQYTITSATGSLLIHGLLRTIEDQFNDGVTGLDNYISWMDMSDPQNVPPRIWDKCCPASDPTADGRIYFDRLTGRTLYLGDIFDVSGSRDLVFAYSFGYLTDADGWQLIGYGTQPEPAFDGVSAFGNIVYVPEPASAFLLFAGSAAMAMLRRRAA